MSTPRVPSSDLSAPPSAFIALPRDFTTHPKHTCYGVSERSLQRIKVSLDSDTPRAFVPLRNRSYGARVARREFAYLILRGTEGLRRPFRSLPPPASEPSSLHPRYLYQKLRAAVANRLILPRFVTENFPLSHHVVQQRRHTWFETSRHVLAYSAPHPHTPHRVVCYLFAPEQNEASNEFFWWFVADPLLTQPNTCLYDDATGLVLNSVLTHRGRRWYCEIVIAPPDLIASSVDVGTLAVSIKNRAALETRNELLHSAQDDSIRVDMDVNSLGAETGRTSITRELASSSAIQISDEHARRADLDWSFVMDQIHLAVEKGRALDDDVIHAIAQRRLMHATETYSYPGHAGATQESSEEIVRGIVDLYRLAADPDFTPSTHSET
jgi:hypothetical protein